MNKFIIVDYRIDKTEENSLHSLGFNVLKTIPCPNLYYAICGHPDILVNIFNKNSILVYKNAPNSFKNKLTSLGLNIFISNSELTSKYPYDIALNAVNIKNLFVHNLKFTDKTLLKKVKNKKLINVKQGYTKCSTAIISDNAIITSDIGIKTALEKESIDVLLLPPGDILLPGLNYGFIGGTCGLIKRNELAFYGNLEYYKYGKEVLRFLKKYNVKPVYLRNGPLVDRGSIIAVESGE